MKSETHKKLAGPQGWTAQVDLIAQAKREGVKRFIPSEFGMDHRGIQSDFFAPKENAFKAAEEAEFPDGIPPSSSICSDIVS
jgi:hypothetical protein